MFSQTVEYSLRTIVALAHHYPEPQTIRQVADFGKVPRAYLQKLARTLVRAGLVDSQRGPGGGIVLAKQPANISIWDVISAVDPIARIEVCPLDREHDVPLCPLHNKIDQAIAALEEEFRECTFGDLLAQCDTTGPLCGGSQAIVPLGEPGKPIRPSKS